MTRNQISFAEHKESQRHNRKMERLTLQQNTETERANKARENENYRSNVAREMETNRANIASETENVRYHNMVDEHNRTQDAINNARYWEEKRHNKANEKLANEQHEWNKYITDREINQKGLTAQTTQDLNKARTELAERQADYYESERKRKIIETGLQGASDLANTITGGAKSVFQIIAPFLP